MPPVATKTLHRLAPSPGLADVSGLDMPPGFPIPNTLPVMVLSDCHVFPGSVFPLFIFEPRYRAMLADTLAANRMFCIGNRIPGAPDSSVSPADIAPVSTAGLVRACIENPDGTSNLILEGVSRIRFTGWFEPKPYPSATVTLLESTDSDPEKSRNLSDTLVELVNSRFPPHPSSATKKSVLSGLQPGQVADFVAQNYLHDFTSKQQILETADTPARLELTLCLLHDTLSSEEPP